MKLLHPTWGVVIFSEKGNEPTSALRDAHKFLFKTQNPAAGQIWLICIAAETLLPPCRIIGQLRTSKQTLTFNFKQENIRYII
jgi:hypothetical protein